MRDTTATPAGEAVADSTLLWKPTSIPTLSNGDQLGRYVIRERLGEGGFAVVYLAEETEPVRRKVALKILKVGMDSESILARFCAESQALAIMDHPNVARVFDAGSTELGRPYFVMEYVKGEPITTYCDRHKLSIPERLELFQQVCSAVQHAHQKGIIHRDLKPSNVLVNATGDTPVSKVIDFGVAKAVDHRLIEKTIFTEHGQLIGTPEYMSPEQAEMGALDIDTRTDVYSLGVILYELIVGAKPFDPDVIRNKAYFEIVKAIREEQPPKPSTRFEQVADSDTRAELRQMSSSSLQRQLRRDLDWIVMKAIEKDRTRRYAGASELAADVRRYLANEPVEAGPPGMGYRFGKFCSRYRYALVVCALVVIAVSAAGVAMQQRSFANAVGTKNAELDRSIAEQNVVTGKLEGHVLDLSELLKAWIAEQRIKGDDPERLRDYVEFFALLDQIEGIDNTALQTAAHELKGRTRDQQVRIVMTVLRRVFPNSPALDEIEDQLIEATTPSTEDR